MARIWNEDLRDTAQRFGYTIIEAYSFPYERPLSGLRNRTICVARVGDTMATWRGADVGRRDASQDSQRQHEE